MECAALLLLARGHDLLAGRSQHSRDEVRSLLGRPVVVSDEWAASRGLAMMARDVFGGAEEILGIPVDR